MKRVLYAIVLAALVLLAITLAFHFWPTSEAVASQADELKAEAKAQAEEALAIVAPPVTEEPDTTRLTHYERHWLKKAIRAYRNGHKQRARHRLHRIKRAWDEIPMRRLVRAGAGHGKSAGCRWAGGTILTEAAVLHTDLFRSSLWVHFCNRRERITSTSRANLSSNIHFLGNATGWDYRGVVYRKNKWRRWHRHNRGERLVVRVTHFEQCVGFATGQFCHRDRYLAQAVLMRGNGAWGYGKAS